VAAARAAGRRPECGDGECAHAHARRAAARARRARARTSRPGRRTAAADSAHCRTAALHLCTLTAPRTPRSPESTGARRRPRRRPRVGKGARGTRRAARRECGETKERQRGHERGARSTCRPAGPHDELATEPRDHATGEPLYVQGDHRQDFFKYFISLFDSCRRCHAAGGRRRGPP